MTRVRLCWWRIDAPGAEPRVQALRTAQFDWLELSASLRVASDLDGLLQRLQDLPAHTVLSLQLEGQLALDLHQRLNAALAVLRGRLRHLSVEASALESGADRRGHRRPAG